MIHPRLDVVHLRFTCARALLKIAIQGHADTGGSEREGLSAGRRGGGKGRITKRGDRGSERERGACRRGGERASIAILHRTEIDTGTAGVTGCGGVGGWVASRGFLYFSRKHYELVRKYLRRAWLSATLGDLRDSFSDAHTLLRQVPDTDIEFRRN